MRGYLVWTLILSALACSESAVPKTSNICDTCRCLPSASAELAKNIQCTCDSTTRAITTTVENMKELPHLESFTVVNCDSVQFQQSSFGNKHDLSSVILKRVKKAIFPLGVFAKLDSLKIEDVDDLQLMAKAFLGAEIGEIAIRNSTIHEIPEFALYDVSLRKLELSDVTIGVIKSNSTMFVMGEQSNLNIDRCQVDRVETGGLALRAQNLRISGCTLSYLAPSSTIIDAAIGLDILNTTFGQSDDEGMRISSKVINIFNNTFYNIPIVLGTFTFSDAIKATITNNFVQEVSFYNSNLFPILKAEFIRNSFLCSCQLADIVKGVEGSLSIFLPNFEEMLANNYCQSNCATKVSVKDFLDHVKGKEVCTPEDVVRCQSEAVGDDQESHDDSTVSGRSGRQEDHDDHHADHHADHHQGNDTTEGPRPTSGHATHGAHFLLSMAFSATFLVFT